MKKHEIIFSTIKFPLDFIIIFISFFLAREIRLITDLIPFIQLPIQTIETSSLIIFALIGSLVYTVLFAIHGIYNSQLTSSKIKEFLSIIQYSIYGFVFFAFLVYLGKGIIYSSDIPRLIILFSFILSVIGIIFERVILNQIQLLLIKKGIINKKQLIIISNQTDSEIADIITDIHNARVYEILGHINTTASSQKIKYIGSHSALTQICKNKKCDEILYIDSDFSKQELLEIWEISRIFGVRYRYITNGFDITKTNTTLSLINQIPVIEIKSTSLGAWGRVIKRIFDILFSITILLLLSPLLIIVGILIKLEDPAGPIIYKNKRIGQNGKPFNLYKFRYIKWKYCTKESYGISEKEDNALQYEKELIESQNSRSGPLYKIKNDPRKTRIGTCIEKYSIDELPQFINVIIGNMSIAGPRPHQPREVDLYTLRHKRLLTIKPGITGMAQVNGRENNSFSDEANLDFFYIENWSFLLDLKIIFKTLGVILKRK